MAISKDKKGEILSKLKKIAKESASLVLVNFHGLPVSESGEIRRELRKNGVGFVVAKKTLTKKALADAGFSGELPPLPGEIGLVYGSDPIEGARGVYEFQKKLDKKIQIIGGVFESKFMSLDAMTSLAQIPSLKTLQAQFVNVINSPIQGLVIGLKAIADKKQ